LPLYNGGRCSAERCRLHADFSPKQEKGGHMPAFLLAPFNLAFTF